MNQSIEPRRELEPPPPADLTGGRLLARNTVWNLVGQLLPMAAALVAVPLLVRALGVERFGLLSLAWIVIGYFSLFDLGMGRALTKLVSDKLAVGMEASIPSLAWTALLLMLLLGVAGGVFTSLISPWLVHRALQVPAAMQREALLSFYVLSASIPVVTVTSGLRGILEALQRFRVLNLIRIPASIFLFAGPLLVLPFSHSLVAVTAVLAAGRVLAGIANLIACFRAMPGLRERMELDRSTIVPVVKFGGWMTVSNVISPVMAYLDRFGIGFLLSLGAVAYYTAPFDTVTRLLVIPAATSSVLFPAFALSLVQNPERTVLLLGRGIKYVFLAVFPLALILITLAPEMLRFWLGPLFAEHSSRALEWLAAGVFINSLTHAPFALIQGGGRPDLTAKLHFLELPFYLVAVWFLTKRLGIDGTAIAWTGRVAVDAILLYFFARRWLSRSSRLLMTLAAATAAAVLVFYLGTLPSSLPAKLGFLSVTLAIFALLTWRVVLGSGERNFLLRARSGELSAYGGGPQPEQADRGSFP